MFNFIALILMFIFVNSSISFNLSPQPNLIFRHPSLKTPQPQERTSYFGFSIVLREKSIIIGAPRAQSHLEAQKEFYETGAIFKCDFDSKKCIPYVFDSLGNTSIENERYNFTYDDKSNQWLGGSMDGGSKDTDKLIVCAPRLVASNSQHYAISGVCYWTNNTLSNTPQVSKISPLRLKFSDIDMLSGEQGFSVHLSENKQEFLIGAPNIDYSRGTVIRSKNGVLNEVPPSFASIGSYFGYAVSSGYYNSSNLEKLYYLASIPQYHNGYGMAYILDIVDGHFKQPNYFRGQKFGEFFGYSVLTEDINGDGLDDIIISAPQYWTNSRNHDIGAIYVYRNKGHLKFHPAKLIVSPSTKSGRFGTTLSKLGDINHDGFNDIAVGAPFEDNGCVYIYLGSRYGLREMYSQKIEAPMNLVKGSMFGHGLSKGVDIDSNIYNDLAIGAPNADAVFVYKSYPVVKIDASISVKNISILRNSTEFKSCYKIKSKSKKHANQELTLKYVLGPRINTHTFSETGSTNLVQDVQANLKQKCDVHKISISFQKNTIFKPIFIEMHYELKTKIPQASQQFCEKCAMVDPTAGSKISTKIFTTMESVCKAKICVPNLRISSVNITKEFVIGSSSNMIVEYEVQNHGEIAYLPKVHISSSMNLNFKKVPVDCSLENEFLVCDLSNGRFMSNGDKDSVQVEFDMSDLHDNESLNLTASASSAGIELNISDNIAFDVIRILKPAVKDDDDFTIWSFPIPWWIFIFSSIAGLVIMSLISYSLKKHGFFKRQRAPTDDDDDMSLDDSVGPKSSVLSDKN